MGCREAKARQCLSITRNDEEFKHTMKNARRELEVPMPAAMLCKIRIKSSGETHRNIGKRKTKYACVVDVDESTIPRLERVGHKPHQDHITAKRLNSITQYSLVHKFVPMSHLWKTAGRLFRKTEKLVIGQTETAGISVIDFQDPTWVSTSLLHDLAYQYSTVKVSVFSDSALLGKDGKQSC